MGTDTYQKSSSKPVGRAEYDELVDLVRQNLRANEDVARQQREIIDHLGGINARLEQDVIDRQLELQQLGRQIERMRADMIHRPKSSPIPSAPSAPPITPAVSTDSCHLTTWPSSMVCFSAAPSNIRIVGRVPTGGVVIPPVPDHQQPRQSAARSWVVVPSPTRSSVTGSTTTSESSGYVERLTSGMPPYRRPYSRARH
ncbi:proteophosphoglycan 5 [Ceratobasidium sp. AG-Ba]|nr:proteophosphoglycan 5 [Ceratobasidium sp. AG-Ba]